MQVMKRTSFNMLVALATPPLLVSASLVQAAPAQQAYVKFSNSNVGENFGWAVAVSGDTMVVGASARSNEVTSFGAA